MTSTAVERPRRAGFFARAKVRAPQGAVWYRCCECGRADWTVDARILTGERWTWCEHCAGERVRVERLEVEPIPCDDCAGECCISCDYRGVRTCASCGAYTEREPWGGEPLCLGCDEHDVDDVLESGERPIGGVL